MYLHSLKQGGSKCLSCEDWGSWKICDVPFPTHENYFGEKAAGPSKARLWKEEGSSHCLPQVRILTGIPESSLSLLPYTFCWSACSFSICSAWRSLVFYLPELYPRAENVWKAFPVTPNLFYCILRFRGFLLDNFCIFLFWGGGFCWVFLGGG